ncbi:hypothetical protein ACILG0_08260 [Pseudomonadota bacterium AL_CKDN230030165-1A_HGKHYDSX7]
MSGQLTAGKFKDRPMIAAERRIVKSAAQGARPRQARQLLKGEFKREAMRRFIMRSILLWLLGVPIPIIILIALFWN